MLKKILFFSLIFLLSLSTFAKNNLNKQDTISVSSSNDEEIINSDSILNAKMDDVIPTVTLEDIESEDEGGSDQGISPILNAGRDVFYKLLLLIGVLHVLEFVDMKMIILIPI
ncbi:MAG: hypothetical protein IPL21_17635 [Saprospirales bacterium]|nr:hypothetical protein [Saprospirales bacterium]